MNQRQIRGKHIAEKQDQIIRIDETHYKVNSQSRDKQHDVISTEYGWSCSCEDRFYRKTCCKHIHAVEISLNIHDTVKDDVVISEVVIDCCKYCKSQNIVKRGIRKNKSGNIQVFCCKDYTRKFSINLGFENMRATPDQITMAMNLYFNGESSRKVKQSLVLTGVKVSHIMVQNWIKKYVSLMEKYLDRITPQVGEQWRTDELYLKIKGDRKYLYALMDDEIRYWIAKQVSDNKYVQDVKPMFREDAKTDGKKPALLISDGAPNFHKA